MDWASPPSSRARQHNETKAQLGRGQMRFVVHDRPVDRGLRSGKRVSVIPGKAKPQESFGSRNGQGSHISSGYLPKTRRAL